MKSAAFASLLTILSIDVTCPGQAQSLRGITDLNQTNLRLPTLTITGVTLSTTPDGGLVETTSGLERLRVEIPTSSSTNTIIETYAGTAVKEVTLFDPRTYSNLNSGTKVNNQGPSEGFPYICGAAAPGQAPNTASTYTVPGSSVTVNTGPGQAPRNYAGEDVANVSPGNPSPNPLASNVLSAGTQFARQPYLSAGAFGNGLPNTAPLQITPFPAGIPYPDCGG
jgi:hypothetical protein